MNTNQQLNKLANLYSQHFNNNFNDYIAIQRVNTSKTVVVLYHRVSKLRRAAREAISSGRKEILSIMKNNIFTKHLLI